MNGWSCGERELPEEVVRVREEEEEEEWGGIKTFLVISQKWMQQLFPRDEYLLSLRLYSLMGNQTLMLTLTVCPVIVETGDVR